jgi:NADH-quinone oxidoreductase subunit J
VATEVIWWIFAVGIVGAAIGVVTSRTVLHSAIFLILSLGGVGAIYVILLVEFLALVQFLIYGGAVAVLILLALMLTRVNVSGQPEAVSGKQAPVAAVAAAALAAILVGVAVGTSWPGNTDEASDIPVALISEKLFVDFGPPFVIASVLLLVALVGAIILARQEEGD